VHTMLGSFLSAKLFWREATGFWFLRSYNEWVTKAPFISHLGHHTHNMWPICDDLQDPFDHKCGLCLLDWIMWFLSLEKYIPSVLSTSLWLPTFPTFSFSPLATYATWFSLPAYFTPKVHLN
jgi:hypothetical protein